MANVNIKETLTFDEYALFVKSVTEFVFNDEIYHPEYIDYAIRYYTILIYTDIEIDNIINSQNILNIYQELYSNDIDEIICKISDVNTITGRQYTKMIQATMLNIENTKKSNFDVLCDIFIAQLEKMDIDKTNMFMDKFNSIPQGKLSQKEMIKAMKQVGMFDKEETKEK